jgi:hypothetical protein
MSGDRTPLDLYMEIEDANGTRYKLDANQAPGSRLQNFSFRSKITEGFSDASGILPRRIDLDYPDLQLGNNLIVTGADGTIVYEGRIAAMPRELGDSHSIGLTFAGHMAHARDRPFTEVYVDRDLSAWGAPGVGRRAGLLTSNFTPFDPEQVADASNNSAVVTPFQGAWASPYKPISEAWYDAGPGVTIGRVGYSWDRQNVDNTNVNWVWDVLVSSDDKATAVEATANLRAAGPALLQTFTPTAQYRYAALQHYFNATAGGADGNRYAINWYKLAVYGSHGLTLHTGEPGEPDGVFASDVMRDIAARWCPELDTSGIEDTDYVIQHLTFKDLTDPYDAFLQLNKYHLWQLAVWENKTLTFKPYDLTDYTWEIRTDDPGTTFSPVGPTSEDVFNGVIVTYTDILTGTVQRLTPDNYVELQDTSTANPWNQWGRDHWDRLDLTTPTVLNQALQIGATALADKNRPKTAGTLTVRGYIRDRAGNPQPVSKVRAGDVICVTNFNEVNRLIVEADYDHESTTVRIAVDLPFQTLEALFDRQATALTARGLA